MKMSRRGGFSLIELLTVIAIIAILAAIIFPVMGMVKERARENQCITNLHQIAVAVQMFKADNRRYPATLGGPVRKPDGTLWTGSGDAIEFESSKSDASLFAEYVKSANMFHCPSSKMIKSLDAAEYTENGAIKYVYAYNSYDAFVTSFGATPATPPEPTKHPADQHYTTAWVPSSALGPAAITWIKGSGLKPYPLDKADSDAVAQEDFERQLKWKTPSGDTVVTWCANHEDRIGTDVNAWKGKALVVFLDGHADKIPSNEMEQCKWRMRPKKS